MSWIASLAMAQVLSATPHEVIGARNLALSPDGSQIAFTYRGDVWVASADGGRARPLTDNVEMDDYATWSPDGKWIAFGSDRNGNWDIFAVPVDGGATQRLTWASNTEIPDTWSADGKSLLFSANYDKGASGLYTLNVQNLRLSEILIDQQPIDSPTYAGDAGTIYYLRKAFFPWNRPRYEGSGASQIWTVNPDGKRRLVRATGFQHLWLRPAPTGVYCVTVTDKTPSSRRIDEKPTRMTDSPERTPNVYHVTPDGKAKRLTSFIGGSGTRFLSSARNGNVVFEREGRIYGLTPGQAAKEIKVTANVDPKQVVEERLVLANQAEQVSVSPDNKTAVLQIRRELWSVPVKKGKGPNGTDATQLTDYAGTDDEPIFSPDGKSVFFVSDRDGALSLYRLNLESNQVTRIHATATDVSGLTLNPDKRTLSYWVAGRNGGLFTIALSGGEPKRILDKPHRRTFAWSPDMRYLAYVRDIPNSGFKPWENKTDVWVLDTTTSKHTNVTQLNVYDNFPVWSTDGRFLYFSSEREGGGIFLLASKTEDARATETELKFEKPTAPVKLDFDLTDTPRRIRRLWSGSASNLTVDPVNGDLLFLQNGDLWRVGYDGEGARALTAGGGIGDFHLTQDDNQISFIKGGEAFLLDLRKPNTPTAEIEFRADWTRDVLAERKAAFHEFWRIYNQQFYDEFFHRRDWAAIRNRYEPLLDSVGHRSEMAEVLNMMVGELEASHAEVGAAPGGNRSQTTAHLGFTIDYSFEGPGVKIKSVPDRTPGAFAKTKLNPGDVVLKVNGKDVRADQNLWRVLNEQSGRDITLTLANKKELKYRAMSAFEFRNLLYVNRIEWRRKYVEEKSGGKLTYVHIAGMGGGNLNTFNNEVWQYVQGKQGLIIDVRENGGGNIADILLDALERRLHMRYMPRDGEEQPGPGQIWARPTVVMHAETSFSNAEMFPAAMKALGLAETVGMPTPGYVIYTYGGRLVDGTSIRLPNTGVYRIDGTPMENMGQVPDHRIDLDPDDYFAPRDPQLDKAIEVLLRKLR